MSTPRVVILVEGESDRVALSTLARRMSVDIMAEGIMIEVMGGITNTRAFATRHGPRGAALPLAGLYDVPDEAKLRGGLVAAGIEAAQSPADLAELGFHCCSLDLEDELIRALGIHGVEDVIAHAGEAHSLRRLIGMPVQRDWPRERVLRRFIGSRSGRKARYAALLVEALDLERAPPPLVAVLAHARATALAD